MTIIDSNIPAEILAYVAEGDLLGNSEEIPISIVLSTDTDNTKRQAMWELGHGSRKIKEYKIKNSGFKFSIPKIEKLNYSYSYVHLIIESDSLTEMIGGNKSFMINLDIKEFLKLIQQEKAIISSDGKVSGEYYFIINKRNIKVVSENSIDEEFSLARKIGKLINDTKRGTSDWIPGHMYYIKSNKKYVIYLGQCSNIFIPRSYYFEKFTYITDRYSLNVLSSLSIRKISGKLLSEVSPIDFYRHKYSNLQDYLYDIFRYMIYDKNEERHSLLIGDESRSKISGVDLGEVFSVPSSTKETEAEMIIKNLCYQKLSTTVSETDLKKMNLAFSFILDNALKDNSIVRKSFLNKQKEAWMNGCRYSWNTVTINTIEDLMNPKILSYVKELFNKDIIKVTDEELDKIKKEVFAAVKK